MPHRRPRHNASALFPGRRIIHSAGRARPYRSNPPAGRPARFSPRSRHELADDPLANRTRTGAFSDVGRNTVVAALRSPEDTPPVRAKEENVRAFLLQSKQHARAYPQREVSRSTREIPAVAVAHGQALDTFRRIAAQI